jgi:hypothetical protein
MIAMAERDEPNRAEEILGADGQQPARVMQTGVRSGARWSRVWWTPVRAAGEARGLKSADTVATVTEEEGASWCGLSVSARGAQVEPIAVGVCLLSGRGCGRATSRDPVPPPAGSCLGNERAPALVTRPTQESGHE